MKLVDLMGYLVNDQVDQLYQDQKLNTESEYVIAYMQNEIDLESDIAFFDIEELDDSSVHQKDGVTYIHLFGISYMVELIAEDLELKGRGYSNLQIAKRLLEYRINDA